MTDPTTTPRTDLPAGDGSTPALTPPASLPTGESLPAAPPPAGEATVPMAGLLAAGPFAEVVKKKKKDDEVPVDPNRPDSLFESMGPRRGVETLFRSSYRVNMDLTSLADAKANIMISINGFIVSILIASIAPGMDANPWLLFPTSIFLVGCLISLVFAILSARPRVASHHVTLDEIRRNKTNILFFGNFANLPESDYVIAMKERMMDPVALYELMIRDIYGVGAVLQRKYTLLRTSYTAFLTTLIVGVVAFILVLGYAAYFETGPSVVYPTTVAPADAAPGVVPGTLLP